MQIKEIKVSTSFGGVISEGPFENIKPSYFDEVVISLDENDDEESIRNIYREKLQSGQIRKFELLRNSMKAELIQQQYQKIRFYDVDGIKYPSVTSIIGWEKDFHITDLELAQYGARGTIIHYMIEHFCKTGSWLTLKEVAENGLREEATILYTGTLKLQIEDCSHERFFEEFGKDFEFDEFEIEVTNKEHQYCGRLDVKGKYKGKKSIIDFKTGSSWEMMQLAAYAKCLDEDIEQLVVCLVGPNDNKAGVKKPVVSFNIQPEFERFLKKRSEFRKRFGI